MSDSKSMEHFRYQDLLKNVQYQIEKAIASSKNVPQQFSQIFKLMPIGLMLLDKSLKIVLANDFVEKILHFKLDELDECFLLDFLPKKYHQPIETMIREERFFIGEHHQQHSCEIDLELQISDGKFTPATFCLYPIFFDKKKYYLVSLIDISKSNKALANTAKALATSEERYNLAINAAQIGVWDLHVEKNLLVWNQHMYQIFDKPPESFHGVYDDFICCIHPEDKSRVENEIKAAISAERDYKTEYRIIWRDGSVRYIYATAKRYRDKFGQLLRMTGICQDITERKQAELKLAERTKALRAKNQELESTNEKLKKTNQELDQFAYVASHDLKAPLRAINNLVSWIEEDCADRLTEKSKKHFELLKGRSKRMNALIEGILRYSRIGRTDVEINEVNVAQLLKEIIDELDPPLSLHINISEHLPIIQTARFPLSQIFANLISNAIKYHNKLDGNIDITVKEFSRFYQFNVKDNGPGIAPEFHQKIFQLFQTLQPRDAFESTGIGLTIVKKIVEAHGGYIGLTSVPGEGAEFYFTWPKEGFNDAT